MTEFDDTLLATIRELEQLEDYLIDSNDLTEAEVDKLREDITEIRSELATSALEAVLNDPGGETTTTTIRPTVDNVPHPRDLDHRPDTDILDTELSQGPTFGSSLGTGTRPDFDRLRRGDSDE